MDMQGYVEVKPDKKGRGTQAEGVLQTEAGLDRVPQSQPEVESKYYIVTERNSSHRSNKWRRVPC